MFVCSECQSLMTMMLREMLTTRLSLCELDDLHLYSPFLSVRTISFSQLDIKGFGFEKYF